MSKRQKATKSSRIMCTQPKHTLTHIMSALFAFWGNVCHGTRRAVCTCIITINNNKGRRSSLFCTVYTQTLASRWEMLSNRRARGLVMLTARGSTYHDDGWAIGAWRIHLSQKWLSHDFLLRHLVGPRRHFQSLKGDEGTSLMCAASSSEQQQLHKSTEGISTLLCCSLSFRWCKISQKIGIILCTGKVRRAWGFLDAFIAD